MHAPFTVSICDATLLLLLLALLLQALLSAGEEARASGEYQLVVSSGNTADIMSAVREELSTHVPEVVPAPFL